MPRKLSDFLESYLEFTRNTESPTSYNLWAGISVVASALQRKVYMKWGHTEIFPNQYIVLIGPSGVRKGEPLTIAREMLDTAGVTLVSEAITREALIRRIKNSLDNYDDSMLKFHCSVTCIAEELSVFMGESNVSMLSALTNWYDSRPRWTYETKNMGIDEIVGVCVNLLASMAPDWIPVTFPPSAIGGGLTSRMMFIVEHKKARYIADPNILGIDEELRAALVHDLGMIRRLKGRMEFSEEALLAYKDWYVQEEKRAAAGHLAVSDPRFAGYNSRRATHVKKIAMSCSVARSDSMLVEIEDLDRGIQLMIQAERNMADVFSRSGSSGYSAQTQDVLNFIKAHKHTTRSEVMRVFYRDIDIRTMEMIETTLQITRFVKVEPLTAEREVKYTWIG